MGQVASLPAANMPPMFADIALPVPIHHTFTYLVPPEFAPLVKPGVRVLVPFGKKQLTGLVIHLPTESTIKGLKPITDVLDQIPTVSEEMLRLARWMAEYYFAPLGEVVRTAFPQGFSLETKQVVHLVPERAAEALAQSAKTAKRQQKILHALSQSDLTIGQIQKRLTLQGIHSTLNDMAAKGWITISQALTRGDLKPKLVNLVSAATDSERLLGKLPKPLTQKQQQVFEVVRDSAEPIEQRDLLRRSHASLAIVKALSAKGLLAFSSRAVNRSVILDAPEPPQAITLNPAQTTVLEEIRRALAASDYKTFLLHGVTGSGKTQVYIEAIRDVLALGKSAIVLVPEISLTPQIVRRFRAYFGDQVAVMHSQMSAGERYDAWRSAREGSARIVIGPRSAVFAPLKRLGLIVVDEEHESSYKQYDATPRYQARDVAILRATLNKAVVILGSATPSVESYYNSLSGKYHLLTLPERVDDARLPAIEIVDMAKERKRRYEEIKVKVKEEGGAFPKHLPPTSLSGLLREQIERRLARKEGVILLQNRRGFSHVVECPECGYVERCDDCDVTLTYHLTKKHLRCHYCGFVKKPPSVCPSCGGIEIRFHAFGTQQVHEELERIFPDAGVLRLDLDTTTRKGAHGRILRQFEEGKADVLLGTQMVAKGLDFPRVTLVGVISADTQMLLPDFRSSERTFQMLTQVAGRAGRSSLAGEVVIQTLQPDHYSLKHVVSHDFPGFYREELRYREQLDYPPFSRIIVIELKGKQEEEVLNQARSFAELLRKFVSGSSSIILGPSDPGIPRMKGYYRKLIVIKNLRRSDPSGSILRKGLGQAMANHAEAAGKKSAVTLTIDVDPQGMM